jgi:hypothetical protein
MSLKLLSLSKKSHEKWVGIQFEQLFANTKFLNSKIYNHDTRKNKQPICKIF